jgi:hypothetical protein
MHSLIGMSFFLFGSFILVLLMAAVSFSAGYDGIDPSLVIINSAIVIGVGLSLMLWTIRKGKRQHVVNVPRVEVAVVIIVLGALGFVWSYFSNTSYGNFQLSAACTSMTHDGICWGDVQLPLASIMLSVFGAILLQTSLLKEGEYVNPHPTPSWVHYVLAAILAFGSFFFAWIWFVPHTGPNCSPICNYNPSQSNISFLSVAIFCALLACVESVIGFKSRNYEVGNPVLGPSSKRQYKFRIFGILFLVIGTFVAFAGFYLLNSASFQNSLLVPLCFPRGCSPSEIMAINAPWYAIFYGGMILVVLGEALILGSKFLRTVKPSLQTPTLTN